MQNASITRRLLATALCLLLAACANLGYQDAGEALLSFAAHPDNSQVRFSPGAEAYARRVAELLPAAARQIESFHHRPFREPPIVHVCDSEACFHRFVPARLNYAAAVVYDNRLLLAPRLFERETGRLRPVLLHELSHLHMGQYRGHYTLGIPVWFHEGLAALAAEGGGADLVKDSDAWTAALQRKHFRADEQHLPWHRRREDAWNISISVFYRQSMLFLAHLRSRDADGFGRLLRLLQDGEDFDAAFALTYHANPGRLAQGFFACVDARLTRDHPLCLPEQSAPAGSP